MWHEYGRLWISSAIPRSTAGHSEMPIQNQTTSENLRSLPTNPERVFTGAEELSKINYTRPAEPKLDAQTEAAQDEADMRFLNQLLAGHNPDDVMEDEDIEIVNTEADVHDRDAGTAGFTDYMYYRSGPNQHMNSDITSYALNCDALNNQYIRIRKRQLIFGVNVRNSMI
jgi:hypothetical protein